MFIKHFFSKLEFIKMNSSKPLNAANKAEEIRQFNPTGEFHIYRVFLHSCPRLFLNTNLVACNRVGTDWLINMFNKYCLYLKDESLTSQFERTELARAPAEW